MKHLFLIPVLATSLLACQQTPQPPTAPSLGTLELQLDNSGNSKGQVSRVRVSPGTLSRGALREADVTFTALNSTATQNDGAFDYLQAQFTVQNTSGTAFQNLTLYAVAKNGNNGNTAIKSITNFGGLTDTDEQTRIAKLMTATHGLNISSAGLSLIAQRADMQLFTPTEVTALQNDPAFTSNGFSSNDKVLGYGFVARRCIPNCVSPTSFVRDIPAGQSGLITIALRIPRSTGTAYNFVMTFAVVDEALPRVTRSVYPPETLTDVENRLSAFGATSSGEIMQLGLSRGSTPSGSFTNLGANTVAVSSNIDDYTALGLERLSSGFNHTCALTAVGAAYCWGDNQRGQLGNNSVVASAVPVAADGILRFSSISAGRASTCAITIAGAAYCWGANGFGQLGNNSIATQSLVPVAVSPPAVGAGLVFSSLGVSDSSSVCALTTTGAAYCWGSNNFRQLGNGTFSRSIPTAVTGGLTFSSLSVGGGHSCALTLTGAAYCWGFGANGELGNNSQLDSNLPVAVQGGLTFSSLGLGSFHSCGLTLAGAAHCWGYNGFGALGDDSTTSRSSPVAVQGGLTFSSLDGGKFHTCALTPDSTAYCWGYNLDGQLGIQITQAVPTPTLVAGNLRFSSLSAGITHSCAMTNGGKTFCWGDNSASQLGINIVGNAAINPKVPNAVSSQVFSSVEVGDDHTCGLTSSGAAYCWGSNFSGKLGDGSTSNSDIPVAVSGGLLFSKLSAGEAHTCGLTITTGFIYCWGYNFFGQLGDSTNTDRKTPVKINSGFTFTNLGAGGFHSCGIAATGVVVCWGDNRDGQIGRSNNITSYRSPTQILSNSSFSSLAVGEFHTCGVTGTQSYCWGRNTFGQLGDGTQVGTSTPTLVSTSLVFTSISTGYNHTCAKATNNFLYCWGYNINGQIGDGTSNNDRLLPTQVSNSSFGSSPSGGKTHTCALGITITLCWGSNQSGQLGNNSLTEASLPTLVVGNLFFSSVSAGGEHTCAITIGGIVYCWGSNSSGQIGRSFLPYPNPTRDETASFKL